MYLLHNFTLDIFQPRENKFYGNRSNRCNWSVITKSVMARLQQKCANGLFCTQKHAQKLFTPRFKLKTSRATLRITSEEDFLLISNPILSKWIFWPLYLYLQNVSVDGGVIYESFWCLCPVAVWRVAVRYWSNHSSSCVNWEIGSGLWSPVSTRASNEDSRRFHNHGGLVTQFHVYLQWVHTCLA